MRFSNLILDLERLEYVSYLPAMLKHSTYTFSKGIRVYIKASVLDHWMNSLPTGIMFGI